MVSPKLILFGDVCCSILGRKSSQSYATTNAINFSSKRRNSTTSSMDLLSATQSRTIKRNSTTTFSMDLLSATQSGTLKRTDDDDVRDCDQTQVGLLAERCIMVNEKDEAIGGTSKKQCHLWKNISSSANLLHRAFSVLLFNEKNEMLIQQRSEAKITYPFHFTNACCSHPLCVETELKEDDAVGVKTAAQRRLGYELGIPANQVPPESMSLMTRIHYLAQNFPDLRWGEHEIDYVLVVKKDVDLDVNRNEVRDVRYVTQSELKSMLAESRLPNSGAAGDDVIEADDLMVTPWFRLLCQRDGGILFRWWDNLDNLAPLADNLIHDWTR